MTKSVFPVGRIAYKLCPGCFRAVPMASSERYCTNCGQAMLSACPKCQRPITSPESRFCGNCGHSLTHKATVH